VTALCIHLWVLSPVKQIITALREDKPAAVAPLVSRNDETGLIARLVRRSPRARAKRTRPRTYARRTRPPGSRSPRQRYPVALRDGHGPGLHAQLRPLLARHGRGRP
jgi:hypothetical protein